MKLNIPYNVLKCECSSPLSVVVYSIYANQKYKWKNALRCINRNCTYFGIKHELPIFKLTPIKPDGFIVPAI